MEKPDQSDLSHHKQLKYCTNRPKYRDGRRLTAVKVNTIKIKFKFFFSICMELNFSVIS